MDKETKIYFAKILREIYELKNEIAELKTESPVISKSTLLGLDNGVEHVINQEFKYDDYTLSNEQYGKMLKYFDEIPQREIENINGYYDLNSDRDQFTRQEWIIALKFMKAEHRFSEIISRIEGSQHSPAEFSNLDF